MTQNYMYRSHHDSHIYGIVLELHYDDYLLLPVHIVDDMHII